MMIDRFGDPYVFAQQLGTLKAEDDWEIARPPVMEQVGGMNGAFDFYGSANYPIQPQTISKSFNVVSLPAAGPTLWRLKQVGTGFLHTADDSGFPGVYTDIRPNVHGMGYASPPPTTLFDSEVEVGNQIRLTFEGTDYIAEVDSVTDDGLLTVTHAADLPIINEYPGDPTQAFEIWESYNEFAFTYAGVETALSLLKKNTIAKGRSKLWALMRDGTKRWSWAKCVGFKPPEKYGNKMAVPVALTFNLPEGLWYAETNSTTSRTANGAFTVTNNGDHPAMLRVALQNLGASITSVVLSNAANGHTWTFGDTIAWNDSLIVDAGMYSCTNGGDNAYSGLALPATQVIWMKLEPGSNVLTLTVTTASASWTAVLTWYDTWL